jgi:hypothetical protein
MNAKFAQLVPEGRPHIYYTWQQQELKYRPYKAAVYLPVLFNRKYIQRSRSSTHILRLVSDEG